jgi:hypothetical protein
MELLTEKIHVIFSHYLIRTAFILKHSVKDRKGKPDLMSEANEIIPTLYGS